MYTTDGARAGAGREQNALVAPFITDAADGGVVHGSGSQSCGGSHGAGDGWTLVALALL